VVLITVVAMTAVMSGVLPLLYWQLNNKTAQRCRHVYNQRNKIVVVSFLMMVCCITERLCLIVPHTMEHLEVKQRDAIKKMSTVRLTGLLLRAGVKVEDLETLDGGQLMDAWAE
jgi:hypothetical protein